MQYYIDQQNRQILANRNRISGRRFQHISTLFIALLLSIQLGFSQADPLQSFGNPTSNQYKNSIATDPFLLMFNSFALVYERVYNQNNGVLLGFWYGKVTATYPAEIEYPGYAHNYAPILAYRRYFWRKLHAEYQLYPGFTRFFEENENKHYSGFSLFTELRVGYKFDFTIMGTPLLITLQWPVGTTIYESNEPESFRKVRKQDPVFYLFFPNIYLGLRF
jgi:hypothetical protein